MSLLHTLLAFLVALGVLVIVHELGHYLVARWCGVKVLRFSVGFGRPLLTRRYGPDATEWVIAALPLGGYVSMLDERELPEGEVLSPEDAKRAFNRQAPLKRMAIVIAGPVANLLLAVALYAGLFMAGTEEPRARIAAPTAQSPAALAGLQDGDEIRAIDGKPVRSWMDARWRLLEAAADRRKLELEVDMAGGGQATRSLDLSGIDGKAIEANFPENIGLQLHAAIPVVGAVTADSPAQRAGFETGDVIVAIDGAPANDVRAAINTIRASIDRELHITVLRTGSQIELQARPAAFDETNAAGQTARVGRLGIAIQPRLESVMVRDTPLDAIGRGVVRTWEMSVFSVRMFGRMLIGEVSLKNLSGPVTIADYAGQSARLGAEAYIGFMALISISLGVLNLLPIPVLDGGHLLYYSAELIKGRPLSQRFIELSQRAGFGVLIALMAIALVNDITRLFA